MSIRQTGWAFGVKAPPLQKLVLLCLTEEATAFDELDCILFIGGDNAVAGLAARCSLEPTQVRAILAELRASRLIEDGPYPGAIRFLMDR